ncbi:MAG: hypothetical protein GY846_07620 [Deltaproteobacteria bacterium]|nr:hypothetical protein [Deltaproteobacteria bacterium]
MAPMKGKWLRMDEQKNRPEAVGVDKNNPKILMCCQDQNSSLSILNLLRSALMTGIEMSVESP